MSESQELNEARDLVSRGEKEKAIPILWKLYDSKIPLIQLDTILTLIVALNHLTENIKLIRITDEGIKIAEELGRYDVYAFLLGRKCVFLTNQLSFLIYRQRSLMLSANVFPWLGFSLMRNKKEFEEILIKRREVEDTIAKIETTALEIVERLTDHYLRGNIYLSLGDFYSSKLLNDRIDLMTGGRKRSAVANISFLKRWGLDKFIIFDAKGRQIIDDSENKCFYFFEKSISEFEAGNQYEYLPYAYSNFALALGSIFKFRRATVLLNKAKTLAKVNNQEQLLIKIGEIEKKIADKNRHIEDYVSKLGLDLPRNI